MRFIQTTKSTHLSPLTRSISKIQFPHKISKTVQKLRLKCDSHKARITVFMLACNGMNQYF